MATIVCPSVLWQHCLVELDGFDQHYLASALSIKYSNQCSAVEESLQHLQPRIELRVRSANLQPLLVRFIVLLAKTNHVAGAQETQLTVHL